MNFALGRLAGGRNQTKLETTQPQTKTHVQSWAPASSALSKKAAQSYGYYVQRITEKDAGRGRQQESVAWATFAPLAAMRKRAKRQRILDGEVQDLAPRIREEPLDLPRLHAQAYTNRPGPPNLFAFVFVVLVVVAIVLSNIFCFRERYTSPLSPGL